MKPTRRQFLEQSARLGAAGALAGWSTPLLASEAGGEPPLGGAEHCIFIWLGGGAAQIDTFDPKRRSKGRKDPGSAYDSVPTAINGVKVSEHLARTAPLMDRVALVRTLHHEEIDEHAAASYRLHVGRPTSGTIVYPSLGSMIAYLKEPISEAVPSYVLMGHPTPGRSPGFLGPNYGFVYLTDTESGPRGLTRPKRVDDERHRRRMRLLETAQREFANTSTGSDAVANYIEAARKGFDLAGPEFLSAFELTSESSDLRNAYGDEFGQRCLLARRLVERGSRFVEVSFNMGFVNGTGWDTHNQGQQKQHLLIDSLDQAFSTLLTDLEEKRLLDKTLVVIGTEFGRPAQFDAGGGRGHHAEAFTCVLAGGGLRTGQVIGETDDLAMKALGRRVSVPDWFATLFAAFGIDYREELYAGNRPVPLTDRGEPIAELFA
ncbi:MAG: DUF1501 domain-containing protein [Planctomycetota bacterium]|nr:MAG: DUF1501 domain-containing protein [Planctomycetota bacterium]